MPDQLASWRSAAATESSQPAAVRLLTLVLIALSLVTLQVRILEPIVLGSTMLTALAILYLTRRQVLSLVLQPAVGLLAATLTAYLTIAATASLLVAGSLPVYPLFQQGFFALVAMAAAVGIASLLRAERLDSLTSPLLWIFTAACVVILLTPLGTRIGLLPGHEIQTRLTGTFSSPNDASLLASLAVTTSLAVLLSEPTRRLAYVGLAAGGAAAFATISHTAAIIVGISLLIGLRVVIARNRSMLLVVAMLGSLSLVAIYALWTLGAFDKILFSPTEEQREGEVVFVAYDDLDSLVSSLEREDCYHQPDVCGPAEMLTTSSGIAAVGYQFDDAAPDTTYTYRIRPVLWEWLGQPVEVTVRTDHQGQANATWADPNEYQVRYGSDDHGWSEWADLDDLTGSGPERLKAIRVEEGASVQMRTKEIEWVARDDLVVGQEDRSAHLLLWPQWQLQVRSPDSIGWSPLEPMATDRFLPLGKVGAVCGTGTDCENQGESLGYLHLKWIGPTTSSAGVLREQGADDVFDAIEARWELWRYGLERSAENLLVGQGLRELDADTTWQFPGVHNVYIMLLGEAGAVTLLLWLLFSYRVLRIVVAAEPSLERSLLGLTFLVIVVFGLSFNHVWFLGLYSVVMGLTAALADSLSPSLNGPSERSAAGIG